MTDGWGASRKAPPDQSVGSVQSVKWPPRVPCAPGSLKNQTAEKANRIPARSHPFQTRRRDRTPYFKRTCCSPPPFGGFPRRNPPASSRTSWRTTFSHIPAAHSGECVLRLLPRNLGGGRNTVDRLNLSSGQIAQDGHPVSSCKFKKIKPRNDRAWDNGNLRNNKPNEPRRTPPHRLDHSAYLSGTHTTDGWGASRKALPDQSVSQFSSVSQSNGHPVCGSENPEN